MTPRNLTPDGRIVAQRLGDGRYEVVDTRAALPMAQLFDTLTPNTSAIAETLAEARLMSEEYLKTGLWTLPDWFACRGPEIRVESRFAPDGRPHWRRRSIAKQVVIKKRKTEAAAIREAERALKAVRDVIGRSKQRSRAERRKPRYRL